MKTANKRRKTGVMKNNNIYVIGRHAGEIPGFTVVGKEAVTFPATSAECMPVLWKLREKARQHNAALVFQALPAQMVAAICRDIMVMGAFTDCAVGAIVSKPGERPAGVSHTVNEYVFNERVSTADCYEEVARLVKHCNPNAKVDGFTVTVDPPMKFEFSHIEWF